MMETDGVTVGVFSLHNSKETKAICNAIEDLGHRPQWLGTDNTTISVEEGRVELDPPVDVIANRLLLSNTEQPCEALGLINTLSRRLPMLNDPLAAMTALHKLATAVTLAGHEIPVPDVLLSLSSDRLNQERSRFGEEAVYKTAIGTHGGGTWKVGADELVNPMVGNRYAFLQALIERDESRHRDIRVYVVGGEIIGAMYRYAPENDWRTNVALGGDVEDATEDLPEEVRQISIDATDAIGLDYAGVDLVESDEGWFVLEVNPTAGFKGLFAATGVSPAPHIAKLAIERVGGTVDDERVERISRTLDDSRPSFLPPEPVSEDVTPTDIGYTEEVVLTGTRGSETVRAKSDTGAKRTSIDTRLAAEIGAGPIMAISKVRTGSAKGTRSRPVVDVVVGVGGNQHTVTASVEDRSHMEYPVILGRDILKHYRVDVGRTIEGKDRELDEEEE